MKRATLLLIALGLTLLLAQVAHAESATVRISPASQNVPSGQPATIEVQVENITDPDGLGSYEMVFTFDPAQLSFESSANGEFLGSTGRTVTCLPTLFDQDGDTTPDPGYVRVGCVTSGSQPGPSGGGTLASLTFDTLCAGTSAVQFERASLSDPLVTDTFDLSTVAGSITVTGTPCATPTPPSPPEVVGDANCSDEVDAIDAALILQYVAGLLDNLPP